MNSSTANIVSQLSGGLKENSFSLFVHYLSTVIPTLLWLPHKIDITNTISSLPSNEESIIHFIQSTNSETLHISIINEGFPPTENPFSSNRQPTENVEVKDAPSSSIINSTSNGSSIQIYVSVRSGTSPSPNTPNYPSHIILVKAGNSKILDLQQPLLLQLQPVVVNQPYEYSSVSSSSSPREESKSPNLSLSPSKVTTNIASWSTLSTLENVLRLAYGPTLNQVLQSFQKSSSSMSTNYLVEAEKYLHELSSSLHRCQQTVLATVTLPEFIIEPEIQIAAQQCLREGKELAPRDTDSFRSLSATAENSYAPEFISRLEGSLLKWLIVIKNFQNEIISKETTDIEEVNDIAIFIAPNNDNGNDTHESFGIGNFPGRNGTTTTTTSSTLSPLSTALSIHNEVSWWNSVDKGINIIQNHLQSHATRLTLTILKEAKKRFAVSAFESESNIRSFIEKTNSVLPFVRSLPIQSLTNADSIPSLTKHIASVLEFIRRTLQTMQTNQQTMDIFRVQRVLWCITYEIGLVSTRILQNMCIQEQQTLISSSTNKSKNNNYANYGSSSISILTLPMDATLRIIDQWNNFESVWINTTTDCYRILDEIDKKERDSLVTSTAKTKRTKDNVVPLLSVTTTRLPYNSLLETLSERIRVAGEFRRNHATFVELLDGLLVSKAIGKGIATENKDTVHTLPNNNYYTANRLMDEMKLIQQQLDIAWNRAIQTAGNPLNIDEITLDASDVSDTDERERWVIAVRTYSNEVERLEQQVGKAIENAIRAVLGESTSTRLLSSTTYTIDIAKAISISTWSELVILFQQLQSWSTISRIQDILRPYQSIFIDLTVLLLQEIIQDAERGPPKEENSNEETSLPPLVQRLQWLLSLRGRCDTAMLRIPSLLCLDPRTVTIDPRCWRQSELVTTLVMMVDKVLQLTDAYSEANGWLNRTETLLNIVEGRISDEEAQKLTIVTPNDIASAKRQLVMKQTPLRIQTVRARDIAHARSLSSSITMNNQYANFIIELPTPGVTDSNVTETSNVAGTSKEKSEAVNDTAVTLKPFGIFTVAFGSLLETIMREIRSLNDSQITKQLVLRIPQSLRILSASAMTVYPQAVIAGKALGVASHTQDIMEDIAINIVPILHILYKKSSSSSSSAKDGNTGEELVDIPSNRSSLYENAYTLVDTLLAKEREQFELTISKVCGKTAVIHWLSDDLEKYMKEISRTVSVFETAAVTLQSRIRTLKNHVLEITQTAYDTDALTESLTKIMQPIQELLDHGIGMDGITKLRSVIYSVTANILRSLLATALSNDIQQKYPSQSVRVIMRAGQVQTEPSFDEVRKRMYQHLQYRIDTVTNLMVPILVLNGTTVPETPYGSSIILFGGEGFVNSHIQLLMNQYTTMVDESIVTGQQNIQIWSPYERFWFITPPTLAQHIRDHHTKASINLTTTVATENILNLWYNELNQLLNDRKMATKFEITGNAPIRYGCLSMESGDIAATCANRLDAWLADLMVKYTEILSNELQAFQTMLTNNHQEMMNTFTAWDSTAPNFTSTAMVTSIPTVIHLLLQMYGTLEKAQYALFTLPTLANPSSTEQEQVYAHGWKRLVRLFAQHEELLLYARREPLPSTWTTAAQLSEIYDNFTRTLTKGLKQLAGNISTPTVPTVIITQEENIIQRIITVSRRWMIEKPVTITGMAVQPIHSLHTCRTFMNELQSIANELRHLWLGIDGLNELCIKFNYGDPFINLRLSNSSTVYSIATVRSNGTSTLGNLETSIKEIIQLWEELNRIWEPLVQLRSTHWHHIQPRTLRTTLEEATTNLAAMDTNLQTYEAYSVIVTLVKRWRSYVPIVSDLRSPSICDRHLVTIGNLLGLPPSLPHENNVWSLITLGNILDTNIIAAEKQLRGIVRQSQGETGIAEFLQEMGKGWESTVWDTVPYRTSHARVVRGWDTHLSMIDDHLSSLGSMKMSPFFSPFATEASLWETRLTLLRQCLDAWIDMQRTWLYLDGLLQANPDIRTQLPLEAQRFGHVDAEYVALTSMLTAAPQVLACPCLSLGQVVPMAVRGGASAVSLLSVAPGNIYQRLQAMSEALNRVQDGLSEFLDRKRSLFARFFFLGDEDLLELLGASRDPQAAVRHLRSMFAGITGLQVRNGVEDMEGDKIIDGITSSEGESIDFTKDYKIVIKRDGSVPLHSWLENVARHTSVTLAQGSMFTYQNLRKAFTTNSTSSGSTVGTTTTPSNTEAVNVAKALVDLLTTLPCESVLLGLWCFWTSAIESAILTGASGTVGINSRASIGGNPRASIGGNPVTANITTNIIRIAAVLETSLQAVSSTLAHSLTDKNAIGGVNTNSTKLRLVRQKLEQSVIDLVHKRDVTRALVNNRIQQVTDFEWRSRLRAYLTPSSFSSTSSNPLSSSSSNSSSSFPCTVSISMADARMDHGLEYHGIGERLVQTPLTDRAYLALMHALHLRLGGCPFGPAGTGKTETVKALGSTLGRFVLVFNTDESFDFRAMGRIFSGLCQVGAWGAFDEFNRLEERVLSAISQQILAIQTSLASNSAGVELLGKRITLHKDVAIFVTMNPGYAGRSQLPDNLKALFRPIAMVAPDVRLIAAVTLFTQGFATADDLATRVTSLFQACATTLSKQGHYDYGLRALKTVLLQAGHAKRSKVPDTSMTTTIPSVNNGARLDSTQESVIVATSIVESVLPKLLPEDIAPFRTILSQTFPEATTTSAGTILFAHAAALVAHRHLYVWRNDGSLQAPSTTTLDSVVGNTVLSTANDWLGKVVQLYEMQSARHGLMILGPTGCGKTSAWRTVLEAMTLVDGVRYETHTMDAKALISRTNNSPNSAKEQFYGKLEPTTLEWSDGVFTATLRTILNNARGELSRRHWIIFDGEVDPDWAESLNSVLDDTKQLSLPSGERLNIPSNVRLVFEVDALRYATLATVSRCGMVCFSNETVNSVILCRQFIYQLVQGNLPSFDFTGTVVTVKTSTATEGETFTSASETPLRQRLLMNIGSVLETDLCHPSAYVQLALQMAMKGSVHTQETNGPGTNSSSLTTTSPIMQNSSNALMKFMLQLLRNGIQQMVDKVTDNDQNNDPYGSTGSNISLHDIQTLVQRIRQYTVVVSCWAFGASYNPAFRRQLSDTIYSIASSIPSSSPSTAFTNYVPIPLPRLSPGSSIYDYTLNLHTGDWSTWTNALPVRQLEPSDVLDSSLIISTTDTLRHTIMLENWLTSCAPVVLCGPPGSGKTMLLNAVLNGNKWVNNSHVAWLSFSSATSPEYILRTLEQYCEYSRQGDGWVLQPVPINTISTDDNTITARSNESRLVVFCDEINLPAADKYGTQKVIAYLRQLILMGGFWAPMQLTGGNGNSSTGNTNRPGSSTTVSHGGPYGTDPVWVSLRNVQFVAACNPPTDAGRVELPSRLLRHTPIIYVGYPSYQGLQGIYTTFTSAICRMHPSLEILQENLALACLDVYVANSNKFTTAMAPQYIYSPRELSRWMRALYEGLLPVAKAGFPGNDNDNRTMVVRLWLHEGLRLFHDRLIDENDRQWCNDTLDSVAQQRFSNLSKGSVNFTLDLAVPLRRPVFFSDWTTGAYMSVSLNDLQSYVRTRAKEFSDESMKIMTETTTSSTNSSTNSYDGGLIVYEDALAHMLRIDRVLMQPLGHLLLAGASGAGKTLLTRFIAWMRGMSVFSVRVSHKYTILDFDRDLRTVMVRTGANCEPIAFIFDEGNVLSTAFLERMNALLASGEVPGLFEGDDRILLLNACRDSWNNNSASNNKSVTKGKSMGSIDLDNDEAVLRQFTRNIQRYLHVVFTMNPATAAFSNRRTTSPALFNRCVVDWFGDWSPQARIQIAHAIAGNLALDTYGNKGGTVYTLPKVLSQSTSTNGDILRNLLGFATSARLTNTLPTKGTNKSTGLPAMVNSTTYTDAIVALFSSIHMSVMDVVQEITKLNTAMKTTTPFPVPFVSPRDYMDMLHQFMNLYHEKRVSIEERQSHLHAGLDRLRATEEAVTALRASLAIKQADLAIKNEAANAKLAQMMADQVEAEKKRSTSLLLRTQLTKTTEEVTKRETEVSNELSEAEPALLDAQTSVQGINRQYLDELRSLASPPAPVRLCMEAVLTLLGNGSGTESNDTASSSAPSTNLTWTEIRKVLKGADFIPNVVNLRTDSLSPRVRKIVNDRYIVGAAKDFNFERINGASKACGPLYKWVVSQLQYAAILERVAPLRVEANKLAGQRESLATEAEELERTLKLLEASILKYKGEYATLIGAAESLRSEMNSVASKVDRAVALLQSLARERTRWENSSKMFAKATRSLATDCVLSAAFLAYGGWYDMRTRTKLEKQWCTLAETYGVPAGNTLLSQTDTNDNSLLPSPALEFLCTSMDRVKWQSFGIQMDELGIGNAVLLNRFRRFPLIIDPSQAAIGFLTRLIEKIPNYRQSLGKTNGNNNNNNNNGGTGSTMNTLSTIGASTRTLVKSSFLDNGYLKAIEAACRFGTPLLLTDAEFIDPVLNPVLNREYTRSNGGGGRILVRIGDTEVDLSPSFTLYLFTRDPTAQFTPDIVSRVTMVNFSITASSLQDTLLNETLMMYAPAVQEQRAVLLASRADADARLQALEERLLDELSGNNGTIIENNNGSNPTVTNPSTPTSQGSILEDRRVLLSLEALKAEAATIEATRDRAASVLVEVGKVSIAYSPIALAACSAYFALQNTSQAICALYQFSLHHFLLAFKDGLRKGARYTEKDSTNTPSTSTTIPQPLTIAKLVQAVLVGIDQMVNRSMYTHHGRSWSLIVLRILAQSWLSIPDDVSSSKPSKDGSMGPLPELVDYYTLMNDKEMIGKSTNLLPFITTLPLEDIDKKLLHYLVTLPSPSWSNSLMRTFSTEPTVWLNLVKNENSVSVVSQTIPSSWVRTSVPVSKTLPELDDLLQNLRTILLGSILRKDLVPSLIDTFSQQYLQRTGTTNTPNSDGNEISGTVSTTSSESSGYRLIPAIEQADAFHPIILFCTPGADADTAVQYASTFGTLKPASSLRTVSMGAADSEQNAAQMITLAARDGGWVLLRNIHLASSWVSTMMQKLKNYSSTDSLSSNSSTVTGGGGFGSKSNGSSSSNSNSNAINTTTVVSNMPTLPHTTNLSFRLIMTIEIPQLLLSSSISSVSYESSSSFPNVTVHLPFIPSIILQESVKYMLETPIGLRSTLLRAVSLIDPLRFTLPTENLSITTIPSSVVSTNLTTLIQTLRGRLYFLTAWFHSVTLERRRYIPQGWKKVYDFSDADWIHSLTTIDNIIHTVMMNIQNTLVNPTTTNNNSSITGVTNSNSATDTTIVPPLSPPSLSYTAIASSSVKEVGRMMMETIHGGRIEYEEDVQILRTLITHILSPSAMQEGYTLNIQTTENNNPSTAGSSNNASSVPVASSLVPSSSSTLLFRTPSREHTMTLPSMIQSIQHLFPSSSSSSGNSNGSIVSPTVLGLSNDADKKLLHLTGGYILYLVSQLVNK